MAGVKFSVTDRPMSQLPVIKRVGKIVSSLLTTVH